MKKEIFVLIFLPALSLCLYFCSMTFRVPYRSTTLQLGMTDAARKACICYFVQNRNQDECTRNTRQPAMAAIIDYDTQVQSVRASFSNWTSTARYKDGSCVLTQD